MLRFLARWMLRLLMLAVVVFMLTGLLVFVDYKRFLATPLVTKNSPDSFAVQAGDTTIGLIDKFEQQGMVLAGESPLAEIMGRYYFRYLAKTTHKADQIKIGEYRLQPGMTAPQLLNLLVSGKTIVHKIRFLEGWNFKQLRAQLQADRNIEQTLLFVPDDELMATLKLGDGNTFYEGQFFPDTYQFPGHTKDSEILRQAYSLMQKNLQTAWQARDKSSKLKSPYELLILASIIEKETSLDSERQQISGVFHRRLAKDMPLQTDPSVIYGMGEKYKGSIYKSDLKRDTPYNTYTRKGLPPTPIAAPGMASLLAAGQPDKGKSLYFVADGKGGHTFSDTYKQHQKAVKAYRNRQRQK